MNSHSLLALVLAVSCFDLSFCNGGDRAMASVPVSYPVRVLRTIQEECPSGDQQQTVIAEVEQDLLNILWSYFGIVCPNLTNPENGQVIQALDGNIPGTEANYSCNPGYTIFGNVSRECVSTGMEVVWTGEAPTCQPVNCSSLLNPNNGQVSHPNGTTFGQTATYSCDPGYSLIGESTHMCQVNATWSGIAPTCQRVYTDCKDALNQGQNTSGIHILKPDSQPEFQAYCDMDTDGGGWTVFQRRKDGSVNFRCGWIDCQQGFGNLSGEFWLGLDKIHRLTSTTTQLRVDLGDFEGNSAYAQYSRFSVGDSVSKYILSVSGYSGTAGNSLAYQNRQKFSTPDQDNDAGPGHCALTYGPWWHNYCHRSSLNGLYFPNGRNRGRSDAMGVIWATWKGLSYSLKFTEMKLRAS